MITDMEFANIIGKYWKDGGRCLSKDEIEAVRAIMDYDELEVADAVGYLIQGDYQFYPNVSLEEYAFQYVKFAERHDPFDRVIKHIDRSQIAREFEKKGYAEVNGGVLRYSGGMRWVK